MLGHSLSTNDHLVAPVVDDGQATDVAEKTLSPWKKFLRQSHAMVGDRSTTGAAKVNASAVSKGCDYRSYLDEADICAWRSESSLRPALPTLDLQECCTMCRTAASRKL